MVLLKNYEKKSELTWAQGKHGSIKEIIETQYIQKPSVFLLCYTKCIRMHLQPNFPLSISKLQTFNLRSSFVSINLFVKNTIKLVLIKYIYVYIKTYKKYKINHIKKLLQCNCPDYFILKGQFFCVHRISMWLLFQNSASCHCTELMFLCSPLKKGQKQNKKNPNTHHRTKHSS